MNILVIDDCEYDAFELTSQLSAIFPDAAITWVSSSEQALSEQLGQYDFCFIDQHMPEVLGTDLAESIRGHLNGSALRIIMLTGDGSDKTRARALISDCDGFLTKPVDQSRLRAFLNGSRCRWEPSDLPRNIEHYWKLVDRRLASRNQLSN